ncbi:hypothetical protein COCC4DRAFT_20830 [Bipolaris maydis ATCC 48331]|uniref:Uncharacterized protein n=2 Tax=Cochliobolus heterostrophus TaxID=5016 RepID=M2T3S0_COCH5|nr:uncharacterized protein COCC4DRAFT_20830 [Bipolaris maydis ATCC 48331]EMD92225.1 hypothetical protein COCHEDRAFT_1155213 [Bipolaris maydis C5]KAH7550851.1 hypothetical protein BM1_10224 [Bipolaris maydis]ENI07919.1 hypothetical protein COCC4DRAFT_20830 [Bipolaris maydis ATCC 48331]KAJ5022081.1 hypothetical protein J3E73DRAFT_401659 [Bipolaris maydis]KAJ5060763.1 hypothetical protein J3E74DRAFT_450487 [Bipolaris maydis]
MNTVNTAAKPSFLNLLTFNPHSYGWATFIVAGGGAYFFAKRSINADRAHKAELDRQKRARIYELEHGIQPPTTTPLNPTARAGSTQAAPRSVTSELGRLRSEGGSNGNGGGMGQVEGNPSVQASQDPAPTRHAPADEGQRVGEKSKYEASDVYRSRKGDRFS